MRLLTRLVAVAACTGLMASGAASACGAEQPCGVATGEYLIRLPDGADAAAPVGAVMYFHGWRGSAAGVMRNRALEKVVAGLGLALVAPNGAGQTWSYPGSPGRHRDEFRFVREVLDDVAGRFPVDTTRIMAAGFSMGGSMVWNLACRMGDRFQGFAPIAGAFWEPLPGHCPSALPRLIHVHGMADRVVPYEGRELGNGFRQGDVGRSIDVWLQQGGCPARASARNAIASSMATDNAHPRGEAAARGGVALDCGRRYACGAGVIELCIHPGGHSVRAEWVALAWRRLQTLTGGR